MSKLKEVIDKIQEIEKLLGEVKLEAAGLAEEEKTKKNKGYTCVKSKRDNRPIEVGDRVRFNSTPQVFGGTGVVESWTKGRDPFLRIRRDGCRKGPPVLRKPTSVQQIEQD